MWTDRRWIVFVAAASLLLNVFLVGVGAGRVFGPHGRPGAGAPRSTPGVVVQTAHVRTLPQDERKRFNMTMAAHRDDIRAARQEQQRLRQITETDIVTEPYDASKVAADFKAVREHGLVLQGLVQQSLTEALGAISPASRAALVERENASDGNASATHP